jgi:hypothetical protein
MNSDSRIYNRITDFVWRVPIFFIDIFINQDEKTVWLDFDLRLSPVYLFFLCWLAHIDWGVKNGVVVFLLSWKTVKR